MRDAPSIDRLPAQPLALFLDVDGTLLDFASTPDAVQVGDDLRRLLDRLSLTLNGALALVSGRTTAALRQLFDPLEIAMAGAHGLERRIDGELTSVGEPLPESALRAVRELAGSHDGLLFESKPYGVALHYRRAPEQGETMQQAMRQLHAPLAERFELIEGNHVLEITSAAADKGSAVRDLMQRDPWQGRLPIYIGDDTTDEPAFSAVRDLGGWAIRVGDRARSHAEFQLDNTAAVRAWLKALTDR